jgi:hypothetical protein
VPREDQLDPELVLDPELIPGQWPSAMAPLLLFVPGFVVLGVPLDPVLELVPVVPLAAVFDAFELDVPLDVVAVDPVVAALFCVLAVDESAAKATDVPTPASAPVRTAPASSCFVRSFMVDLPRFFSGGGHIDTAAANRGPAVKRVRRP